MRQLPMELICWTADRQNLTSTSRPKDQHPSNSIAFFLKTGDLFPEAIVFRLSVGNVQSIRINPSPDYVIHWPAAGSTVPQGMADSPPSPVEYMKSSVGNSRSIQSALIGAPWVEASAECKIPGTFWRSADVASESAGINLDSGVLNAPLTSSGR